MNYNELGDRFNLLSNVHAKTIHNLLFLVPYLQAHALVIQNQRGIAPSNPLEKRKCRIFGCWKAEKSHPVFIESLNEVSKNIGTATSI